MELGEALRIGPKELMPLFFDANDAAFPPTGIF